MEKIARVQDEIHEATEIMRTNIEQVVGRGEHLELLVDKCARHAAQKPPAHTPRVSFLALAHPIHPGRRVSVPTLVHSRSSRRG